MYSGNMNFLITAAANALALWVTTLFLSGVRLEGVVAADSFLANADPNLQAAVYFLLAGAVLGAINMFVRPVVRFLSLPLYILTLGLFFFVVNALMIMLTSWFTGFFDLSLSVDGFWWALAAGIIVGLVNWVLGAFLPEKGAR